MTIRGVNAAKSVDKF